MEYFSAVKGKKVLINLTVWMNLRNMLKKIDTKGHMLHNSIYCNIQNV